MKGLSTAIYCFREALQCLYAESITSRPPGHLACSSSTFVTAVAVRTSLDEEPKLMSHRTLLSILLNSTASTKPYFLHRADSFRCVTSSEVPMLKILGLCSKNKLLPGLPHVAREPSDPKLNMRTEGKAHS